MHREQFTYDAGAADKRGRIIASNDAGCAYPWPLKVGTKFECAENVVLPNGWKVRYDMKFAVEAGPDRPVLVDKFLEDATEVDVDCITDVGQFADPSQGTIVIGAPP